MIGAINPTRFTISQNFLIAFVVIGAQIQMHREPLYQPVCILCCLAVTCCVVHMRMFVGLFTCSEVCRSSDVAGCNQSHDQALEVCSHSCGCSLLVLMVKMSCVFVVVLCGWLLFDSRLILCRYGKIKLISWRFSVLFQQVEK